MVSNGELQGAFEIVGRSREKLFQAAEAELEAREDLKSSEAAILNTTDPKALGGNEAARTAAIRAKTIDERVTLENAERAKRYAQLEFDLASMAVDCLKWQIRNDQSIADLDAQGIVEVR